MFPGLTGFREGEQGFMRRASFRYGTLVTSVDACVICERLHHPCAVCCLIPRWCQPKYHCKLTARTNLKWLFPCMAGIVRYR